MARELITGSPEETAAMAQELGRGAGPGDVFALIGELGTGKTVIAKGIALGMGIRDDITSPTFTILEVYENPLPLYHFDLYRIDRPGELDGLGFDELWYGDGVSVIEWADRAGDRLPADSIRIHLSYAGEEGRRIVIEYPAD
ncbi:MAG: tRNA (adenosine(37)-N6)-threonylcarbamoyltransferase complex ATPase subunit type 1 TsaE [Spirochaetes bacterium]|nr:tRNA (adenosine(37)-N6)-threonylcarbamoyltransferase complex ATPase subunit type 1 TsaE [Spirochaetota bacterium]